MSSNTNYIAALEKYFTITTNILPNAKVINKTLSKQSGAIAPTGAVGILKKSYENKETIIEILKKLNNHFGQTNTQTANTSPSQEKGSPDKLGGPNDVYIITNVEDYQNKTYKYPVIVEKKIRDIKFKDGRREYYKTPFAMFFSSSPAFLPSATLTDISVLYMSCFNQLELSRLFPYVDFRFNVADGNNNYMHLTKIIDPTSGGDKFYLKGVDLAGATAIDKKSGEPPNTRESLIDAEKGLQALQKKHGQPSRGDYFGKKLYDSKTVTLTQDGRQIGNKGFGMEIFTSPQVMAGDTNQMLGGASTSNGLKDPYSGFMTIKSFSFSERVGATTKDPAGRYGMGMLIHDAKIVLELHDKSRLGDILELLQTTGGIYGKVGEGTIDIEFGYYHADENNNLLNSPLAQLVKKARQKRRFEINTTEFSIKNTGGVEITLTLLPTVSAESLKDELYIGKQNTENSAGAKFLEQVNELQKSIKQAQAKNSNYKQQFRSLELDKVVDAFKGNKEAKFLENYSVPFEDIFKRADIQIQQGKSGKQIAREVQDTFAKIKELYEKNSYKIDIVDGTPTPGPLRQKQTSTLVTIEDILTFDIEAEEKVYKSIINKPHFDRFVHEEPHTSKTNDNSGSERVVKMAAARARERGLEDAAIVQDKNLIVTMQNTNKKGVKTPPVLSQEDAIAQMVISQVSTMWSKDSKRRPKYVSFAHIIQRIFVTELLSMKAGNNSFKGTAIEFDEIQIYFHKFNDEAGYMGGKNIGGFLINYSSLLSRFMYTAFENSGANLSLKQCVSILSDFFEDSGNIMYKEPGSKEFNKTMQFFEKSYLDPKTGTRISIEKNKNKQNNKKEKEKKKKLKSSFKTPKLSMFIDSQIHEGQEGKKKTNVLRINFYDAHAPAFQSSESLLSTMFSNAEDPDNQHANIKNDIQDKLRLLYQDLKHKHHMVKEDNYLDADGNATQVLKKEFDEKRKKILEEYNELSDALQANGQTYVTEKRVKQLLKASTPTINPYSESSLVIDLSFSAAKAKGVEESRFHDKIKKQNGARQNDITVEGNPQLTSTGEISGKMMGNFYLRPAQEYYIDLETGTELDNVYHIMGTTHSIDKSGIVTSFTAMRHMAKYLNVAKYFTKGSDVRKNLTSTTTFDDIYNQVKREENDRLKNEALARYKKYQAYVRLQQKKKAVGMLQRAGYEIVNTDKKTGNLTTVFIDEDGILKVSTMDKYGQMKNEEALQIKDLKKWKNTDSKRYTSKDKQKIAASAEKYWNDRIAPVLNTKAANTIDSLRIPSSGVKIPLIKEKEQEEPQNPGGSGLVIN